MLRPAPSLGKRLLHGVSSTLGAVLLTLAAFLVLPLMQTIGGGPDNDLLLSGAIDSILEPPPPPPEIEQPEPEPEPEPEPPKLVESAPPLDLAQLELALNPGFGDGFGGEFEIDLGGQLADAAAGGALDDVFSLADLDQKPRPLFQRPPTYPSELFRARQEGTVDVVFTVDQGGRVIDPRVSRSTHPGFERAAVEAVRSWKFEPGQRDGQPVTFKMKQEISFRLPG